MAKRLSEAVSSWTFRVALLLLWTAAVQSFFWSRLYYTGDEPHYLMSAISFLEDGDFNLYNNFMRGDQRKIGYPELAPQYWFLEVRENPTLVPAEHGTVFPILIAYPYK